MSTQNNREADGLPSKEIFFRGKHVVITGGASGIGRSLSEHLTKLGANVSVIDISPASDPLDKISFIQADVTNKSALEAKVSHQKIDLLIIGAGVTSKTNEPTQQEQDLMEAVNVTGVKNTLDVFESRLTPDAQVVYIGSDNPPKTFYADTKKRGAELVEAFANSHPEVDMKIILLGPVRTQLFEKGKPLEVIQIIAKNVGLYEPPEFANELTEWLIESSQHQGLTQKIMYKPLYGKREK